MAPSTPAPPRRDSLAAFTMASTSSSVMSLRIRPIFLFRVSFGAGRKGLFDGGG